MKKEKLVTLNKEKYETDIQMFGVFLMNQVMDKYISGGKLTIIIEDEFKKYEKEYLKNGSSKD